MEETGRVKSRRKAWILSTALLVAALGLAGYSGLSHAATPAPPIAGDVTIDPGTGTPVAATPELDPTTAAAGVTPSGSQPAAGSAAAAQTSKASPTPKPGGRLNPTASPTTGGTTEFSGIVPVPLSTDSTPTQSGGIDAGGQTAGTPSSPAAPPVITGIQMATSLASDGSAVNPRTTFNSATDQKIIAVVSLKNTVPGTTIKYVHIHGTNFVQSATFTFKTSLNHFYVQFAAPVGGTLPTGHFALRFYLDGQEAGDISYDVI